MNKKLTLILVFMVLATMLVGCGGNKLVGTWEFTEHDQTITFNDDGTFQANADGQIETGEYRVEDNILIIISENYGTDEIEFVVANNELQLIEGNVTITLNRK